MRTIVALFFSVMLYNLSKGLRPTHFRRNLKLFMSVSVDIIPHKSFIEDTAKVNAPPRLATLLQLLHMNGEEIVNPSERNKQNLNPFLIPLSKDKSGSMTCYIRWPTQKDSLDLQIVRTTETGVALRALSTDHLLRRIAAEMDFFSTPKAEEAIKLLTDSGLQYAQGDYLPLLKSGKFEIGSKEELQLVLDRYLLTKVGAFPDCFERLATNFKSKGDEVSALITCERAVSIFYGWGHPMTFHSNMLHSMSDRQKEASDVAKAALGMPLWTLAGSLSELETITQRAGFSGLPILAKMHAFRADDPRTADIAEGTPAIQVVLDSVAHYMDAVALGHVEGGWSAARQRIAEKYKEGGYPELYDFITA